MKKDVKVLKGNIVFILVTLLFSLLFLQFTTTNFIYMVELDDLKEIASGLVYLVFLPSVVPVLSFVFSKQYKRALIVSLINLSVAAGLILIANLPFTSNMNYEIYILASALACLLFLLEAIAPLCIKITANKFWLITQMCSSLLFLILYALIELVASGNLQSYNQNVSTVALIPLCLTALILPLHFAIKGSWGNAVKTFLFTMAPVLLYSLLVIGRNNGDLWIWNYTLLFTGGVVCIFLCLFANRKLCEKNMMTRTEQSVKN